VEDKMFEIMRMTILTAAVNPATADRFTDASVYAWVNRVYPFFAESSQDEAFAASFDVTKDMMNELVVYLDEQWRAKEVPTYYDLETKYRDTGRWDRLGLIRACRYSRVAPVHFAARLDQSERV